MSSLELALQKPSQNNRRGGNSKGKRRAAKRSVDCDEEMLKCS